MGRRLITDDNLHPLDLTAFNNGVNPHGDASVHMKFSCDNRRSKIRRLGFENKGKVLDLLCGFGAWLIFLAEMNDEVWGIDKKEGSIRIAQGLCDHFGIKNTKLFAEDVSYLKKFPSDYFDAVWVWNALIYVDRGPTLDQIQRILKPGGVLVIGAANSTGRILEKLFYGLWGRTPAERNSRSQAISALRKGPLYDGCPNIFTMKTAGKICENHGLRLTKVEPEGKKRVYGFFPQHVNVYAYKPE